MEHDAILTDAPVEEEAIVAEPTTGEETTEKTEPRLTPHAQAMEAIAKQLYGDDDAGRQEEPEPQQPEPEKPEPKPQTVKVKVDGEEKELSLDEVVRGYQKDATASRRLEEAANLRKQAEQEWAAVQAEKAKLEKPQAAPVVEPPSSNEAAKRIYESLLMGDEEEGVKAITELLSTGRQPAIPMEQVADQAAERARYQIEYSLAEKKFLGDFQDIAKDPDLKQLAMNFLGQTVHTSSTYDEAFAKAGDATRDWLKSKAESMGFTYTPPQDVRLEKIERKQQLDTPRAANARTPRPKEEREPTAEEIIADMRRKRGLPV